MKENKQGVFDYHEQTKHLPHRYAASPAGMDWATEPLPYRLYEGAETITLPLMQADPAGGVNELFTRSAGPAPFTTANIAAFFELSMGLSAIKTFMESTWALRMNPSSGNLHPTEAYIITMDETPAKGVFHYTPFSHGLEQRAEISEDLGIELGNNFKQNGFITCLTSIDWREAWKYGARAFRYSCLDAGHAAASMSFSAALLGWRITHLQSLSDEEIKTMLGFTGEMWTRYEEERVEGAFFVQKATESRYNTTIDKKTIKAFKKLEFKGRPNRLSSEHVHWPIIEEVALATDKEETKQKPEHLISPRKYLLENAQALTGVSVIRGRRSAQAYNGEVWADKKDFFSIIDSSIPRPSCAPFDTLQGAPQLNLIVFIHRVRGLEQGLYILLRDRNDRVELEQHMKSTFSWRETELKDLYLLQDGDLTEEARYIFCQQDIAGDGVFSAAMIARFKVNIETRPSMYRELFMEAGIIGQSLYIAAEARGLRGTGIGCFYDDMLHDLLGFPEGDNTFQTLYHFTVGSPLLDSRITTTTPYAQVR